MASTTVPRQPAGIPVGGQFASHDRSEAAFELLADPQTVDTGLVVASFTHDGKPDVDGVELTITHDEQNPGHYTLFASDGSVIKFESLTGVEEEWLEALGAHLYDKDRISKLRARLGQIPALDTALNAEIARLEKATVTVDGMRVPSSWDGGELHRVSWMGERLEADEIGARADYAEIGEAGVSYGYRLGASVLDEIVAGPAREGESEFDYRERADEAWNTSGADWAQVGQFFLDEYGAELLDDSGDELTVEFYVECEDGDTAGSSLELMDERVESETKLLTIRNEYEYGGGLQSKLAAVLGYRYERTSDTDFWAGRWVKDES